MHLWRLAGDLVKIGGRCQDAHLLLRRKRPAQVFVGQARDDQTQVDQVAIDRVKSLARLGESFEAGTQPRSRRLDVPRQRGFGSRHGFALEMDLVEIAEMPHLAGQKLDLQMTGTPVP